MEVDAGAGGFDGEEDEEQLMRWVYHTCHTTFLIAVKEMKNNMCFINKRLKKQSANQDISGTE